MNDTTLDFCGEKMKWSYQINSTLICGNLETVLRTTSTQSCHPPTWIRDSYKSLQRSSKVSRCCPKQQIFIWIRSVAESNRIYFSLPRTPNSTFSRHSYVSSSCCPMRWQQMLTIFLSRRFIAKGRSLRVYTTRFWGEELADLCKLRFASSGEW